VALSADWNLTSRRLAIFTILDGTAAVDACIVEQVKSIIAKATDYCIILRYKALRTIMDGTTAPWAGIVAQVIRMLTLRASNIVSCGGLTAI